MRYQILRWLQVVPATVLSSAVAATGASAQNGIDRPPDVQTLLAFDRDVIHAFLVGDADGYAKHLSDYFFMYQSGYRATKDYAVAMVEAIDCKVDDDWQLSAPQMTPVGDAAYVLSYQMDIQASCASADIAITLPTPVRASTLWIHDGSTWKIAYHGENAIIDPDNAPEADPADRVDAADGSSNNSFAAEGSPNHIFAADDRLTPALLAAETAIWGTWQAHNATALAALTADDISFVNLFGDYFSNKADTIANWTGPLCDVNSFSLRDGVASLASPSIGILTVTGSVEGNCGGQDIRGQRIYATSIYVKDGLSWKWAFGFNSP